MLIITKGRDKLNISRDSTETHLPPFINDRPISCNPPLPIHSSPEHQSQAQNGIWHQRLRCQICKGLQSLAYHQMHSLGLIGYPSVGTCSRRSTGCLGLIKEVIRPIPELLGSREQILVERWFSKYDLSFHLLSHACCN